MIKIGMLCLGEAGGNIGNYANTKGFKVLAANTAKIDLDSLTYIPNENKIHFEGFTGAGRNREVGQKAMIENAEKIYEAAKTKLGDCDAVFVVASGGGGTGSGSLPVGVEILSEMFDYVGIIMILPDESEGAKAKMNALDCFAELSKFKQLGSIFVLDNQKAHIINPSLPKHLIYKKTNEEIINLLCDINKLTTEKSYTHQFDDKDFLDIINTRGCTLVAKADITPKISFKVTPDDIAAEIRNSWDKAFTPDYNHAEAVKVAILSKLKESQSAKIDMMKIFQGEIPYDIKDALYTPNNDADIQSNRMLFYTILSGLPFPESRLNSIKDNIEKIETKLLEKIEKSQTQTFESVSWKTKFGKVAPENNTVIPVSKLSLKERLAKYK